jgi:hypothetical protein
MPDLELLFGAVAALMLATAPMWRLLRHRLNAESFCDFVERLIRAGDYERLIKVCRAVTTPATELTLGLLALELPQIEQSSPPTHYRDGGSAGEPFEARVGRAAEGLKAPLVRWANAQARWGVLLSVAAIVVGLAAGVELGSTLAGASYLVLVASLGGAIALVLTLFSWRDLRYGLDATTRTMLTHLAPVEKMTEEARSAARAARDTLARAPRRPWHRRGPAPWS